MMYRNPYLQGLLGYDEREPQGLLARTQLRPPQPIMLEAPQGRGAPPQQGSQNYGQGSAPIGQGPVSDTAGMALHHYFPETFPGEQGGLLQRAFPQAFPQSQAGRGGGLISQGARGGLKGLLGHSGTAAGAGEFATAAGPIPASVAVTPAATLGGSAGAAGASGAGAAGGAAAGVAAVPVIGWIAALAMMARAKAAEADAKRRMG